MNSSPLCPTSYGVTSHARVNIFFSATGIRVVGGGALLITMQCYQQPAWTDTLFSPLLHANPVWICVSLCLNCSLSSYNSLLPPRLVSLFHLLVLISSPFPLCSALITYPYCNFSFLFVPLCLILHPYKQQSPKKTTTMKQSHILLTQIPRTC